VGLDTPSSIFSLARKDQSTGLGEGRIMAKRLG
jgi:hypothetical protein